VTSVNESTDDRFVRLLQKSSNAAFDNAARFVTRNIVNKRDTKLRHEVQTEMRTQLGNAPSWTYMTTL
jgi:hypothetical protein